MIEAYLSMGWTTFVAVQVHLWRTSIEVPVDECTCPWWRCLGYASPDGGFRSVPHQVIWHWRLFLRAACVGSRLLPRAYVSLSLTKTSKGTLTDRP